MNYGYHLSGLQKSRGFSVDLDRRVQKKKDTVEMEIVHQINRFFDTPVDAMLNMIETNVNSHSSYFTTFNSRAKYSSENMRHAFKITFTSATKQFDRLRYNRLDDGNSR